MVDIVDKATRSRMMSAIRSSNTKPEQITKKALHHLGYRYRHDSKVGKITPDIVLPSLKVAIFVHGCYWHQHEGCKMAYSDREYDEKWLKKFQINRERDRRVCDQLIKRGWRVAIIWECVTRNPLVFDLVIEQLHDWIQKEKSHYFESDYRKA